MNSRRAAARLVALLSLWRAGMLFAQGTGDLEVQILGPNDQPMTGIHVLLQGVDTRITPNAVWYGIGTGRYSVSASRPSGIPFNANDVIVGMVSVAVEPATRTVAKIPRDTAYPETFSAPDGGGVGSSLHFDYAARNPNDNFEIRTKARLVLYFNGRKVFDQTNGPVTMAGGDLGYFGWDWVPDEAGQYVLATQLLQELEPGKYYPVQSSGYVKPILATDVLILSVTQPAELTGGQPVDITIQVRNRGGGLNPVTLRPTGLPAGWYTEPEQYEFSLAEAQTLSRTFTLVPSVAGGKAAVRWLVETLGPAGESFAVASSTQQLDAEPVPGNLTVIVTDRAGKAVDGLLVQPTGLTSKTTPNATWQQAQPGTYPTSVVRKARFPFTLDDVWVGQQPVQVVAGTDRFVTLVRDTPYLETVSRPAYGQVGSSYFVTAEVRAPLAGANLLAKTRMVVYRNDVKVYDATVGPLFVAGGGLGYYGFEWRPTQTGYYLLGLQVQSELEAGRYYATDSMVVSSLEVAQAGYPVVTSVEVPKETLQGDDIIAEAVAQDTGANAGIVGWEYVLSGPADFTETGTIPAAAFALLIPTGGLLPGDYVISVRARDRDGHWSNYRTATMRILDSSLPRIVLISPNAAQTGTTNLQLVASGRNTTFSQGRTFVYFSGSEPVIRDVTVVSAAELRLRVDVPLTSLLGFHDFTAITGTETAKLAQAFSILPKGRLVSMMTVEQSPGDTFEVPVVLNEASGLLGYYVEVQYDDTYLEFLGARSSNLTAAWGNPVVNESDDIARLAGAGATPPAAASGNLALMTFRLAQSVPPNTVLPMRILKAELNDGALATATHDGAIVVAALIWGDLNGDGADGTLDSSLILQWKVGLINSFPVAPAIVAPAFPPAGDVGGDGLLGTVDSSLILQKRVGLIDLYPVQQAARALAAAAPGAATEAAGAAMRSVTIPFKLAGAPGALLDLPIAIDDASEVLGWYVDLSLPADLVALEGVVAGELTSAWGDPIYHLQGSRLRIAASGALPLQGGGVLARIVLRVSGAAVAGTSAPFSIEEVELNDGWIAAASSGPGIIEVLGDDTDGDGMPNTWELTYALDPADPADAAWDSDGDGFVNRDEHTAGTSPRDAADFFAVSLALEPAGQEIVLAWQGAAGRLYRVQTRSAAQAEAWSDATEELGADPVRIVTESGAQEFRIALAAEPGAWRYLRVLVEM